MASCSHSWGSFAGCQNAPCNPTYSVNASGWSLSGTTISASVSASVSGSQLAWATAAGSCGVRFRLVPNSGSAGSWVERTMGKGSQFQCGGFNFSGSGTCTCTIDKNTTSVRVEMCWGFNSGGSSVPWQAVGCSYSYTLPSNLRLTPPSGLSVSDGYASVSDWGSGSGKIVVKTYNCSGSLVKTESSSTSSSKYFYFTGFTGGRNTCYSYCAEATNSNGMSISKCTGTYYNRPPCPNVVIKSCVYNPSTKKCVLSFDWSKASDVGTYTETISYAVTDNDGRTYASGTLATVSGGGSRSGSETLVNIETAVNCTVKVTCSSTAGSCTSSTSVYSPVAGAAFLGFTWDELRRTCTILGTAPGAKQTRISAGYAPNNYNVGTKVSAGEYGDLVVKDLKHGDGEILYLEAMPEATDNHKYIDEVAKISIPIPNPIIGIWTPTCEAAAKGVEQKYIVDIIEKKKDATSCTPRWKVGDRVVKIAPCNPDQAGRDALPVCNECGPGQDCAD